MKREIIDIRTKLNRLPSQHLHECAEDLQEEETLLPAADWSGGFQ